MRLLTFIFFLAICASCNTTKNTATSKTLNGEWVPVQEEIGGTVLPKASFQTQKLVINDSSYTFTAESVDKGVVKRSGDKMDIYGKEGVNKGKHFTAIYKFENDQLSICYNLKGDSYPESFDTKGKPMFFLCSFKKQ
ncbi:MAG TPA: TIGR03067 domain-containing protein [Chitinophagaceae bacterium]|nr:TIGR03067 domain-containing protein [Chitinophagaceae bacterium]